MTQAVDGRPLGRRGLETRRRLLEATEDLLAETTLRDLRVVDIARRVGSSSATFYQYFKDVEDAVLALAEKAGEETATIGELASGSWKGAAGLQRARDVVTGFLDYWDRHRAVLRVRNLASEEGDARFRDVRAASLQPITEAFYRQLRAAHKEGRIAADMNPYAAAAALVAMLERMSSFHRELESRPAMKSGDTVETTARILHQTITGS